MESGQGCWIIRSELVFFPMSRVIFDTLTLEQFLKLPEAKPALEYIDGMVVQKASPKRTQSSLQVDLGSAIRAFARPRRLGRVYSELRIISPAETIKHLPRRLRWCLRNGVKLAGLIQPRKERALVFRQGQEPEVLDRSRALEGEEVIPGFQLPLDDLLSWIDED
jgi:Uma2 family endonuclease